MPLTPLRIGYLPLTDAAPLAIAREMGFAAEEGLDLDLRRLTTWAQCRDMLCAGMIDAAHMLSPMPVGLALGLGPAMPALDLVMFLSHGGQVFGVNREIEAALRAGGHDFDFADARKAGAALRRVAAGRLRVGVPFVFSTHVELVARWLGASGFAISDLELITTPPPRMADAIETGEVDAFCVGEPWGSIAVERGAAALLLPGTAIWASPPEKGLALRRDRVEARPRTAGALMRALWRAGRWLDAPGHRAIAAEILARPDYLDLPVDLTERSLTGQFVIAPSGEFRAAPGFTTFHDGAANFPWRSVAALFAARIAERHGLPPEPAMKRAMARFRTDLYRTELRAAGAALPGASARREGALDEDREVPAEKGSTILRADAFFDGATFEPPQII